MRTLAPILALCLLCSCASLESTTPKLGGLTAEVKEGGQKVASATARGAGAVSESVGTAYRGVKKGFDEPDRNAYGPYPRDYVNSIRRHMLRFGGVDKRASMKFGEPVKCYLNRGLLRGGEVDWQGWVVDVTVESTSTFGQPEVDEYVVRMKDGEIVELVEKDYAKGLRRVSGNAPPVPAAGRR